MDDALRAANRLDGAGSDGGSPDSSVTGATDGPSKRSRIDGNASDAIDPITLERLGDHVVRELSYASLAAVSPLRGSVEIVYKIPSLMSRIGEFFLFLSV